jgi:hypothetical protein
MFLYLGNIANKKRASQLNRICSLSTCIENTWKGENQIDQHRLMIVDIFVTCSYKKNNSLTPILGFKTRFNNRVFSMI